jgi:hypothetical protein
MAEKRKAALEQELAWYESNKAEWLNTHLGEFASAGHITERQEFVGAISFPGQELSAFDPMSLIACPLPEQDVSCLIGHDVLERWNLTYDGRSGLVVIEE